MRVGLRTKLVVLMVIVAILPLLIALLTIVIGGRNLRNEVFSQSLLTTAKTQSTSMEQELSDQIKLLRVVVQQRDMYRYIGHFGKTVDSQKAQKIEENWASYKTDSREVKTLIDNEAARELKNAVRINAKLSHVVVTDTRGYLIAATSKTPNFIYKDVDWWKQCYDIKTKKGRDVVSDVIDTGQSDKYILRICIPIYWEGRVVGVAKAEMPVKAWLPASTVQIGDQTGYVNLYRADGSRVLIPQEKSADADKKSADDETKSASTPLEISKFDAALKADCSGGYRQTEDSLQAYVALSQDCSPGVKMPKWILLVYIPSKKLYGPLSGLMWMILVFGLVVIGVVFAGGYFLIDRIVINRIAKLGQSARQVAAGELTHRTTASWAGTKYLGKDELDELSQDFNYMVRKLEQSHGELTEANELKENFIRIAGHELRTPVSYIVGMASLMKNCKDPERLAKAIDTMGFKAGRLDEIIQAMFKLIPSQKLTEGMEYSNVNISELLESIYLDMQPWIERRKQTLVIEPGDKNTVIQADRNKLRDIIESLTMNAVKFTPNKGTVRVCVARQLGGYVIIKVIDQGPGIPESDQPYVFQPFFSGSDILRHSTGKSGFGKRGMGLGLAIAKHFADKHNGKITFQTSEKGTAFSVTIPVSPVNGATSISEASSDSIDNAE